MNNDENFKTFEHDTAVKLSDTFAINYQHVLGSGAFGTIYLGYDYKSNKEVAIKMESQRTKNPQLIYESKNLKLLQGGSKNILKIIISWHTKFISCCCNRRIFNNDS